MRLVVGSGQFLNSCLYTVPPTGGGNRGSLPRAPSVRGPPNSAKLVQILAVYYTELLDLLLVLLNYELPSPQVCTQLMVK